MLSPAIRAAKALRGRVSTSVRRAGLDDPAAVDHHDPVGQQQRVEDVVGDQDGGPVGEHPAQRLPQRRVVRRRRAPPSARRAAAAAGRRPGRGRRRPAGPGRRTAGRGAGRRAPRRPTSSSQARACVARRTARVAAAARAEGDVLERAQVREEQRVLGEQRDPPRVRRHPDAGRRSARRPSSTTRPVSGRSSPAATASSGRLAGAVGPEHRDGLAVGDVERDVDVALGRPRALSSRRHQALRPGRAKRDDQHGDHDQHQRQRDGGVGVGLRAGCRSRAAACGWCPGGCPRR